MHLFNRLLLPLLCILISVYAEEEAETQISTDEKAHIPATEVYGPDQIGYVVELYQAEVVWKGLGNTELLPDLRPSLGHDLPIVPEILAAITGAKVEHWNALLPEKPDFSTLRGLLVQYQANLEQASVSRILPSKFGNLSPLIELPFEAAFTPLHKIYISILKGSSDSAARTQIKLNLARGQAFLSRLYKAFALDLGLLEVEAAKEYLEFKVVKKVYIKNDKYMRGTIDWVKTAERENLRRTSDGEIATDARKIFKALQSGFGREPISEADTPAWEYRNRLDATNHYINAIHKTCIKLGKVAAT